MDIEKLKRCLKCCADDNSKACNKCELEYGEEECQNLCGYAATALSTLQAENARLREELEYEREHANAYHEECGQWETENEKLRAELEKVKEDWSTAVNGLVLMQKKLNKVYRMLYDPLIIVDGGHLRPVKNTSRQQVYKKLVDLQVEMGINRGFPWGEMRMEKKED